MQQDRGTHISRNYEAYIYYCEVRGIPKSEQLNEDQFARALNQYDVADRALDETLRRGSLDPLATLFTYDIRSEMPNDRVMEDLDLCGRLQEQMDRRPDTS